jgi:hypothetical protein
MHVPRLLQVLSLVAVLSLLSRSSARAQQLSAAYGVSRSSHELIRTLDGFSVQLMSDAKRDWAVGGGFRRYFGGHFRAGNMCLGGSIGCQNELVRDVAKQAEAEVLGALTLFRAAPAGRSLHGRALFGFQVVRVQTDSRGQTTGLEFTRNAHVPGLSGGFDVSAQPSASAPVGLRLGMAMAGYAKMGGETVVYHDSYKVDAAGAVRLELGVTWSMPTYRPQ